MDVLLQYYQSISSFILETPNLLVWMAVSSLLMFFGTIAMLPFLIIRIPRDYFCHNKRKTDGWLFKYRIIRHSVVLLKNLLGCIFLIAGFVMLFVPGQGILTMLIGLTMTNFPGKYSVEQRLIKQKAVFRVVNGIRRRWGRKPVLMPGIDPCQEDPDR